MSERGRSRSPKPLSPLKGTGRDISMSRSRSPRRPILRSRSPSRQSRGRTLSPRNDKKGNVVVVITGLTKNVQKGHLEEIFGVYGRIVAVDLPTFEVSGLNKGKAAVQYDNPADAEKAASHMDGGQLDNAFLKVVTSEHPIPPPAPPRRPISRSPVRRRRSPSYSRSPSPPRGASGPGGYRRRSPSPRGYRGPPGNGRFGGPPRGGYGGGPSRGGYGPPRGGFGGPRGGYNSGPGRYRSRSPPYRPADNRTRRPSPSYGRRRSYSRSLSRSRSRSRSPPPKRGRSRSYSRSLSRSLSPLPRKKRAYSRSISRSRSRSRSRSPARKRSYSRSLSRSPRK